MKKQPDTSPARPDLFATLFYKGRINSVIIMDESGHILQVNDAFKNTFGYTENEIIGKHGRILFTEQDQNAQRPEMEIILVKKQGHATDQNYTVHKNGQHIWVSGESVFAESKEYGNCIIKVIQNIHAQKLQENFLREANEFSQTIFESIDDGLLVTNIEQRILKANGAFYRMFDLPPATLEGAYLPEVDTFFKRILHIQEKLPSLPETGHTYEELEWNIPGGDKHVIRLTSKFLEEHPGHEKRILLLFQDITNEKKIEQQREDLINFVSHELRNPMANLALLIELLPDSVKRNDTAEIDEFLEKATINLRRLKQVISELHDATHAGTGQLAMKKERFEVQEMIREAIDSVRLLYPSHEIIPPAETKITIDGDRFRLVQVLNNYLTNAIKYSPNADKVSLNVSEENGTLTVSVSDHGPGIPQDQLPFVFNKYYRGRSSFKVEGLGLGLYVCREIIRAHGGEVWVESELDKGSSFYFSVPA